MNTISRIGLIGVGVAVGILTGGVAGFFLTWFACVALDPFYRGLASAGWVYCFVTVPAGGLLGAVLGGLGADRIHRSIIRRSHGGDEVAAKN